jgi:hypothetical protein
LLKLWPADYADAGHEASRVSALIVGQTQLKVLYLALRELYRTLKLFDALFDLARAAGADGMSE